MSDKTESKYSQLCDELKEIAGELKPWYVVEGVKPYAVYTWVKGPPKTHWLSDTYAFDILPEQVYCYDENHVISEEVWPIIRRIQTKLCEIRDYVKERNNNHG